LILNEVCNFKDFYAQINYNIYIITYKEIVTHTHLPTHIY
jgi:hypothetical protein